MKSSLAGKNGKEVDTDQLINHRHLRYNNALKNKLIICSLLTGMFFLFDGLGGCKKNENPNDLQYINQSFPENFETPRNIFIDNPLSEEGFQLGRKLFYDGRLSLDGNYPCASCHNQIAGFGTFEHDRSHGYNSSHTLRNAPVLFNLAWQNQYHWDGRYSSLFDEAAQPINEHTEMAESFNGIVAKLQKDASYRDAFRKVFRSNFISAKDMLKALAQFTGSLISADSRYDRYKKGQATLTANELSGYQVFQAKCNSCHKEPMFTDYSYRNIGLPIDPLLNDYGRLRVTGSPQDSMKFKVPTLRNTFVSSNYMHDGRFNTIAQCLNHYRTGVQKNTTTDPLIANGIALTNTEATNITLFLRTLTDSAFLLNPRFAKP